MDEEAQGYETVEIDAGQWVTIEFSRRWPKYVAEWSVRQQVSQESDFPVASGVVERMPPKDGESLEDLRDAMRAEAVRQANEALAAQQPPKEEKRGLLGRLFGR